MTRETKVGLLVGMGVILLVGIILTDHLTVRTTPDVLPLDGSNIHVREPVPGPDLGNDPIMDAQATELDKFHHVSRSEKRSPVSGYGVTPIPTMAGELVEPTKTPAPPSKTSMDSTPTSGGPSPVDGEANTLPNGGRKRDRPQEVTMEAHRFHSVKNGESLWQIAEIYYGDGRKYLWIKEANPDRIMADDNIRSGVRLLIPPKPPLPLSSGRHPRSLSLQVQAPPTSTVTVRQGDTLGELASKHLGSSRYWKSLVEANRDQSVDERNLQPGMVLKLPKRGPSRRSQSGHR